MAISTHGANKASLSVCNRRFHEKRENGKTAKLPHQQAALIVKVSRQQHKENLACYDAGKNVNGRKRHLLVDTLGLVISAYVSPANLQDRDGLKHLLNQYFETGTTRLRKLWVDGGYRGDDLKEWVADRKQTHKIDLEVVTPKGKGFQLVKRRWVVERTFAWLLNFRRLSKDYEALTDNSEAIYSHCYDLPLTKQNRLSVAFLKQLLRILQ